MPISHFGRYLFGAAAFASGVVTLVWHNAVHASAYVYAAAAAQIVGGVALQLRRTAIPGAVLLAAVYLAFALVCVPRIIAAPRIYDSWGNFFEPFSLAVAAAIVYSFLSWTLRPSALQRFGRISLGICVVSFTLEQAFYLGNTAILVPKWLPPSPMFWALATTVLFALAALALLANLKALLAARLLTLMLLIFGFLVWIPLLIAAPLSHVNWSETTETFTIAGAAWILAAVLDNRGHERSRA